MAVRSLGSREVSYLAILEGWLGHRSTRIVVHDVLDREEAGGERVHTAFLCWTLIS